MNNVHLVRHQETLEHPLHTLIGGGRQRGYIQRELKLVVGHENVREELNIDLRRITVAEYYAKF